MNMMGMVGGLLAPWTIPMILQAAGNWQVPILVLAAAYFVGSLAWLGDRSGDADRGHRGIRARRMGHSDIGT